MIFEIPFILLVLVLLSFITIITSLIILNKLFIEKKIPRKNLFIIFLILFILTAGLSIFALRVSTSFSIGETNHFTSIFQIELNTIYKILSEHKDGKTLWLSYFTEEKSPWSIEFFCRNHIFSYKNKKLNIYFFEKNDILFPLPPPSDLAAESNKYLIAEYHYDPISFKIKKEFKYSYDFLLFRWGMTTEDSDFTYPASRRMSFGLLETKPVYESKAYVLYKFVEPNETNMERYDVFKSHLIREHKSHAFLLPEAFPYSLTFLYQDKELVEGSIELQKAGLKKSDYERAFDEYQHQLTEQYGNLTSQDYPSTLKNLDGFSVLRKMIWILPRTEVSIELLSLENEGKVRINFKKR